MLTLRFESAVLCSDIHLSKNTDKISTAFIHWLKESCLGKIKAKPEWLLILGDLFDAWIGDDLLDANTHPLSVVAHEVIRHLRRLTVKLYAGPGIK